MSESSFIAHVTEATFDREVLERSYDTLVVVDFWAGWCNPCKILMPVLSNLAEEYNGSIFLAKVDTDVERKLAETYGIRSLPSVRFFKQGQIVDEFNGALPSEEIRLFIEKNQFKETDFDLHAAKQAFDEGDLDTASRLLRDILLKDPDNRTAILLQVKIALQHGDVDFVDQFLAKVPLGDADSDEIKEITALNEFSKALVGSPTMEELELDLANNDNLEKRFQLASHYALQGQYEKAIQNFLMVMENDRNYKDDGARKSIIAIFDLLGGSGPIVNTYRVKMSRLLH